MGGAAPAHVQTFQEHRVTSVAKDLRIAAKKTLST
jgi:hypothetical protein